MSGITSATAKSTLLSGSALNFTSVAMFWAFAALQPTLYVAGLDDVVAGSCHDAVATRHGI